MAKALDIGYRKVVASGATKVVDEKAGRIHAVVSTETPDRSGDIIRQEFWKLDHFLKHPVLLSDHNYGSILAQIGEWEDMSVKGKNLEGVARYYINEGNADADWGFKLAAKGKAAFSVGFIPDMEKAEEIGDRDAWFGSYEFKGQELLEVSHVTIPANPEALQMVLTRGMTEEQFERMRQRLLADVDARIAKLSTPAPTHTISISQLASQIHEATRRAS